MLYPRYFRYFSTLALGLSLWPALLILRMVWAGVRFPMELEVREGAVWLHVLALKAGISMYDHSRVAFFSNHGPVDHLLKWLISEAIPSLPSQAVTRAFVFTLPFCLAYMFFAALRPVPVRAALALAAASALFTAMANLNAYNLLVGRTDPLSLSLLAVQAGLTARILYRRQAGLLLLFTYALLMALGIFALWRMIPVIGSLALVAAVTLGRRSVKSWLKLSGILLFVHAAVFLFLLYFLFAGNLTSFYQHFIGVFFVSSWVPLTTGHSFPIFPPELMAAPALWVPALLPLALLPLSFSGNSSAPRGQRIMIALLVLACFVLHAYGYNRNKGGGGLYYFSPYLIVAWFFAVYLWAQRERRGRAWAAAGFVALYLALVPSWAQINAQTQDMEQAAEPVGRFRETLEQLDAQGLLTSEELHFHKKTLGTTQVDNGDGAAILIDAGFFDENFRNTGRKFFADVRGGKYPFYLFAGIPSRATQEYLSANYEVIATVPPYSTWNGPRGCVTILNCHRLLRKK